MNLTLDEWVSWAQMQLSETGQAAFPHPQHLNVHEMGRILLTIAGGAHSSGRHFSAHVCAYHHVHMRSHINRWAHSIWTLSLDHFSHEI